MTPRKTTVPLYWQVWPTAWGAMGAAASPAGLRRIELPHYNPDDLAKLLAWEHPGAVRDGGPFSRLVQLTADYFNAKPADFCELVCDLPAEKSFGGKVLRACR